jgi:hypothetical protein
VMKIPRLGLVTLQPEEMPNRKLQQLGRGALKRDPRTADWQWEKTRKTFMRAVGREKLK